MEHLPLCKSLSHWTRQVSRKPHLIWIQERCNQFVKSTHTPIRSYSNKHLPQTKTEGASSTKKPQGLPPGANGYCYTGHDLRLLQAPLYLGVFGKANSWHLGMGLTNIPCFNLEKPRFLSMDLWVANGDAMSADSIQHGSQIYTNMRCQQQVPRSLASSGFLSPDDAICSGGISSMKQTRDNLEGALKGKP